MARKRKATRDRGLIKGANEKSLARGELTEPAFEACFLEEINVSS